MSRRGRLARRLQNEFRAGGVGADGDFTGRTSGLKQIHAIESRTCQRGVNFFHDSIEVCQEFGFTGRTRGRILNRHSKAFQFGQCADHGFTRCQSHVHDRLTALQGLLYGVLSTHFRTLRGRNSEDGTVVLGR